MPKLPRTPVEEMRQIIGYNPETGAMTWRVTQTPRTPVGSPAGSISGNGRKYIGLKGDHIPAHRVAWAHVMGTWPIDPIRPRNGDYCDLRFDNLEVVTASKLAQGSSRRRTNTSGHKGISWDKLRNKWVASITRDYKQVLLGRFEKKEDAIAAYDKAASEYGMETLAQSDERARLAIQSSIKTRQRRTWYRLQRDTKGVVGWPNFDSFCEDVIEFPDYLGSVVALNQEMPVGPGNWKWERRSEYDLGSYEGRRRYRLDHKKNNPELHKNRQLLEAFGITLSEYEARFKKQKGVCAICKKPETVERDGRVRMMAVDHCHTHQHVRGLLCSRCNQGIGYFGDDPAVLRRAIAYLERNGHPPDGEPDSRS